MDYKEKLRLAKEALDSGSYDKETIEYIFPELKESEGEKTKRMLHTIANKISQHLRDIFTEEEFQCFDAWSNAWLEKQGEHAKFRDSIQVGDKVTRNQDGVLVNLSQLNRVAKKEEKQSEQKPAEWSDNDEWCLEQINFLMRNSYSADDKVERLSNWVKSIKDRLLPQLKQEWCKEAENNILFLTSIIEECFKDKEEITLCDDTVCANFTKEDVIDRLKSLNPQPTWKPSKEQIMGIDCAIKTLRHQLNVGDKRLNSLYDDLKKLKGE